MEVSPSELILEQSRPSSTRRWTLNGGRLTIGRDPSSNVFVDDPGMSRHHADLIGQGSNWSIVDAGSTNGTYVNGARIRETAITPGDRIGLGSIELVLRQPGVNPQPGRVARYDVGSQVGNISNVAGDQNYYHESNLRYIASQRGRARKLVVWGLLLFFMGQGVGLSAFLAVFASEANPNEPPPYFVVGFGLGAFMVLLGGALFIFGLIARSGAKQEARRRGVDW